MNERFLQQLLLNERNKTDKTLEDIKNMVRDIFINQTGKGDREANEFLFDCVKRMLINMINYIQEGQTSYSNEAINEIEQIKNT